MKKINRLYSVLFLLAFLLFFSENAWQLEIFGEQALQDQLYVKITAVTIMLLFLFSLMHIKKKTNQFEFKNVWVLFFCSIIISHFFGAVRLYNQPLSYVLTSIIWFSGVLIYFYLNKFFSSKFYAKKIFNLIIMFGLIACFLAIGTAFIDLDVFVTNRVQETERFGFTRVFGFGENAVILTFIYYFILLMHSRNAKSFKNISFFLISGITLFFVFLSRQIMFSLFAIFIIYSIKNKIIKNTTAIYFLLLLVVTVVILMVATPFFSELIQSLNYNNTKDFESGTFAVRIFGIAYYFEQFAKTLGTGFGWISIAPTAAGTMNPIYYATQSLNFYLVDQGIFQTLFQFGILGVIVIVLYVKKIISNSKTRSKEYEIEKLTLYYFIISRMFALNYLFTWPLFTVFYGIIAYISERFAQEKDSINLSKRVNIN